MEFEAGQEAEQAEITLMTQAPPGNVDSTNIKQDAEWKEVAISQMRRRVKRCKDNFSPSKCFQLIPHHGEFPCEQCPSEWIGYKTKCYFISEQEENWTSSQTFCARNESSLAVFESQEEMYSLVKRLKIDDSWIGLSKKGERFYWENGVAFKEDSFHIWNHSECAYLDAFTISTSACSLPRRWICSRLPT